MDKLHMSIDKALELWDEEQLLEEVVSRKLNGLLFVESGLEALNDVNIMEVATILVSKNGGEF